MTETNWEQYVKVVRTMNKLIHDIHNEFASETISQNVFTNISELETVNRAYNHLCKEMKKKSESFTEEQMNLMNKDVPFYRNTILNAKKLLIYYYNKLVYEIIERCELVRVSLDKIKDSSEKMALFDGIEIPTYTDKVISNYQDKISLDFATLYKYTNYLTMLEGKLAIPERDKTLDELNYIKDSQLGYIEETIKSYGVNKNVTKNSIEKDIFWVNYVVKNIRAEDKDGKYNELCSEIEKKISVLKEELAKKKSYKVETKDNEAYYELRELLELYKRELTDICNRLSIRGEPLSDILRKSIKKQYDELERKYKDLPEEVQKDKLLCNNLLTCFTEIKDLTEVLVNINREDKGKKESPSDDSKEETPGKGTDDAPKAPGSGTTETPPKKEEPPKKESSGYDADYEVIEERNGKEAYNKYGKIVLLSSALSTISLTQMILPFLVPAVIAANMYVIYKCELADKINNILGKRIGAKKNKDGTWVNNLGEPITIANIVPGLLKCIVITGEGKPTAVGELVEKVKGLLSYRVVVTKEPPKKYTEAEIKKMVSELYKRFVTAGMSVREFCESEKLTPDVRMAFDEYVIASMTKGGRSK